MGSRIGTSSKQTKEEEEEALLLEWKKILNIQSWYSTTTTTTTNHNNNHDSSSEHHHQALVRPATDHVPSTPDSIVVTRHTHKNKTKILLPVSQSVGWRRRRSKFFCLLEWMNARMLMFPSLPVSSWVAHDVQNSAPLAGGALQLVPTYEVLHRCSQWSNDAQEEEEAELNVLTRSFLLHHLSSYKTSFFPICQETKQAKQR